MLVYSASSTSDGGTDGAAYYYADGYIGYLCQPHKKFT